MPALDLSVPRSLTAHTATAQPRWPMTVRPRRIGGSRGALVMTGSSRATAARNPGTRRNQLGGRSIRFHGPWLVNEPSWRSSVVDSSALDRSGITDTNTVWGFAMAIAQSGRCDLWRPRPATASNVRSAVVCSHRSPCCLAKAHQEPTSAFDGTEIAWTAVGGAGSDVVLVHGITESAPPGIRSSGACPSRIV